MPAPSSRHLSHDFKAYKEMTLRELFITVVSSTFTIMVFFILIGLASGWVAALAGIGFFLGFLVGVYVLPKFISRIKMGKPHGHLMKQITLLQVCFKLKKSPFIKHTGIWQKSKRLGKPHV